MKKNKLVLLTVLIVLVLYVGAVIFVTKPNTNAYSAIFGSSEKAAAPAPETVKADHDAIIAEAEKQKVKPVDDAELQRTLPYLRNQLKALVARDLWDMSEYYQVSNDQNHIYRKGLEVILR